MEERDRVAFKSIVFLGHSASVEDTVWPTLNKLRELFILMCFK